MNDPTVRTLRPARPAFGTAPHAVAAVPHARAAALPATEVDESREFAWTNADFVRVQSLIHQRAGISLHDGKHAMVYSRLSRRLRETGHGSFQDYLAWLESHDGPEWQEFINALTTNLTAFFREQHHFEVLASLLRSRPGGPWSVWCSAASTGEEPYSIVMTALESLGANASFKLMASDIDSRVLATASQGVYRQENLKGLSQERLQRFFLRGKGANAGLARVKPELRRPVEFLSVNLIRDDWPFREAFDVVFCRNVMIYFDAPTQRRVLERIHRVLKPGGMLFVGHAENFSDSRDLFTLRGKTVYERV
ncbi:CheR family methyltransferase [Melaminivora sp.]|uniref:CheR family methyltransferase n=1 Tax=Melaminivora sp. TaxID=1933032 RepID=UPI0028B03F61|nr:CheR family methyltransferase [Melaminivora sp.]